MNRMINAAGIIAAAALPLTVTALYGNPYITSVMVASFAAQVGCLYFSKMMTGGPAANNSGVKIADLVFVALGVSSCISSMMMLLSATTVDKSFLFVSLYKGAIYGGALDAIVHVADTVAESLANGKNFFEQLNRRSLAEVVVPATAGFCTKYLMGISNPLLSGMVQFGTKEFCKNYILGKPIDIGNYLLRLVTGAYDNFAYNKAAELGCFNYTYTTATTLVGTAACAVVECSEMYTKDVLNGLARVVRVIRYRTEEEMAGVRRDLRALVAPVMAPARAQVPAAAPAAER